MKNKLSCGFENLAPQSVKNIAEPVLAYRIAARGSILTSVGKPIRKSWPIRVAYAALLGVLLLVGLAVWQLREPDIETASVARMALPLPNQPSIAVLPFTNLGLPAGQDILADGIARDIITDLSAFADLMVIASTSSFSYKDKPAKTHQVAEDLSLRFVLDGSIQAAGENIRINILLVDAISGEHLWGERYDREMGDIFAIQDEITQSVVSVLGAMEGPIAMADRARTRSRNATNLTAYEYVLLARDARNQ